MSSCGADVKIQATPLHLTIGADIPLGLPLTFVDDGGDPYAVDVAHVTATVGDLDLTVAQTASNVVTVSASADDLAALSGLTEWAFAVDGVPWLAGMLRVTATPGCSATDATVVVQTSPTPVTVTVDTAAPLAGQVADLGARLAAVEAFLADSTFLTDGGTNG